MKDLRLHDLGPLVVAWHNRHPLARRIGVEHVHSVGYVVMPFVGPATAAGAAPAAAGEGAPGNEAPGGASLRERAMARARQAEQGTPLPPGAELPPPPPPEPRARALRRAFNERFLPPWPRWALARFGARHGVPPGRPVPGAPIREILVDPRADNARVLQRWVMTAQIDGGGRRSRVLVGAGAEPAILGRRLLSTPRVASVGALVLAVAAGVAMVLNRPSADEPAVAAVVLPASAAAWPARPASAAAPPPVLTLHSTPPLPPASAPVAVAVVAQPAPPAPPAAASTALPASAAAPAERPVDVDPTLGRIELPSLGPRIDARRRAAEEARQQAAADAAASAAAAAARPTPPDTATATAPRIAAAEPPRVAAPAMLRPSAMKGTAFALSTRLLRTRTESEQVATAMRALLAPPGTKDLQVEVMPAGDDFRVVGWPYADRASALQAQTLLASRGLKVQVIDF